MLKYPENVTTGIDSIVTDGNIYSTGRAAHQQVDWMTAAMVRWHHSFLDLNHRPAGRGIPNGLFTMRVAQRTWNRRRRTNILARTIDACSLNIISTEEEEGAPMPESDPERDTPPTMTEVSKIVTEFARSLYPHLSQLEIVMRVGSNVESRMQIPLTAPGPTLADRIIEALQTQFKPGYVKGAALAGAVDCERNSGSFKSAITLLKETGRIDSSPHGYKLIE